jgi:hypothetical protein
MAQEPILNICQLSFHTNAAGKNNDTHITVTVRTNNGIIAARIDNDFGHFGENSDNGPFDLEIINPVRKIEAKGGNTTIRIDPSKSNTWQFNFFLDLIFSDGSHLSCEASNIELDEKRQQSTFGIS